MKDAPVQAVTETLEGLLDLTGAAEFLGFSEKTTQKLTDSGLIPFVRIPGTKRRRFLPSTLRQLAEHYESTNTPSPLASTTGDPHGSR